MIELHERLSEFSYGYGVTREAEKLLAGVGIRAVPYMPNLIDEKKIGFDVAFNKGGTLLLLQFKLGQSLTRFHRTDKSYPAPALTRPFWRFSIDTAEPDGQFETLLKAENDGAEVYYAAPRFSDWPYYAQFFEAEAVLDHSVLVRPSVIRSALVGSGASDGAHRIVYDAEGVHVCSRPMRISESSPHGMASNTAQQIRQKRLTLAHVLDDVLSGFNSRSEIRRPAEQSETVGELVPGRAPLEFSRGERDRRFHALLERSRSREDAVAAVVGMELWTLGIQLIFVFEPDV
jgi:hypothetical protein